MKLRNCIQEYSTIASSDDSFDFHRLIRRAIDYEDQLNQTTVNGPNEALVILPGPTPSDAPPIALPAAGNHTTRAKKTARKRKRQAKTRRADGLETNLRRVAGKKHTHGADDIKTNLHTEALPTASTGFVGKAEEACEEQYAYDTLQDLLEQSDFQLIEYEPKSVPLNATFAAIISLTDSS